MKKLHSHDAEVFQPSRQLNLLKVMVGIRKYYYAHRDGIVRFMFQITFIRAQWLTCQLPA